MYDSVLVPTDGSEHAVRAAEHATVLAGAFDATVHVVHVVDLAAAGGPFDAGGLGEGFVDRLEAEGRATLDAVEAIAAEADRLETAVVHGEPADEIIEYAAEHGVDLIAMGTHGRTGIRRYIAGSVTERVVRLADVPVVTVRATDRNRSEDGYDDVMIPTDGSDCAALAVEHGIAVARAFDATVHVVHVVDVGAVATGPNVTPPATVIETLETAGEQATEPIVTRASDAGLDVVTEIREGFPARSLLDYADEAGVDLIAMGTHGRRGVDRFLLGSTAAKLVRRADVPVLTVRDADGES